MRAVQVDLGGRARRVGQRGHGELAAALADVHLPHIGRQREDGRELRQHFVSFG